MQWSYSYGNAPLSQAAYGFLNLGCSEIELRVLSHIAMMRQETPQSGACPELDAFCRTWIISSGNPRSKMITQSVTLMVCVFIYSMNSSL